MAEIKTGWERDKKMHFDTVVMRYDKVRPDYPAELFADIIDFAKPAKKAKALEIGAGTGKATAPFLDAGYEVTAVEIGANMASFLRERFKEYANFNVTVADFEDIVLEDESLDLIYSATAFHWVNADIGCPKIFRALKKGGVFALFRYNHVPRDGEALYEELQALYEKHYQSYYTSSKRPVKDDYGNPNQILHRFGCKTLDAYGFADITMKLYDGERIYDTDEYMELLETMSDHRHLPEENRMALYAGIKEAVLRHGGLCKDTLAYQLYMGRKI